MSTKMKLGLLRPKIKKGGNVFVFLQISDANGNCVGGAYAQIIKSTLLDGLDALPDSTLFDVEHTSEGLMIGKPRVKAVFT